MKMMRYLPVVLLMVFMCSCKHEPSKAPAPEPSHNYPPAIANILVSKCATAGCHNQYSYQLSGGGLRLDSWEHLFDGGNTGAAVVPFSIESSPMLYFTNTFPDLGPVPDSASNMRMPLNGTPLSREEYLTLRNWVVAGAPDKDGNIAFASNADTRQKIYLAHQGCDYLTVIDAEKNVVMRCVPVGKETTIDAAYSIKVSGDGYAYMSYWSNQYIQKFDTRTDALVDEINLGNANSNILYPSPDGKELLLTNLFQQAMLRVSTQSKQVTETYGSGSFTIPHGIAANSSFDTFFVTEQFGNTVYRVTSGGTVKKISIDGNTPHNNTTGPNPYNITMSPDHSKYFLSCSNTNEIRVMDAYADTLIAVIPVGTTPREMAVSLQKPYLFVSCMDDAASINTFKGSVYIINYNTLQVVHTIKDRYYMPQALAVDDQHGKLFVFSRNIDVNGPKPHHSSSTCSGRNGFYSVYDFNTLQPVNNKRYEVTIEPFAADVRFK